MCREIAEGGRRCPSCAAEIRSARDRARYATKKAAAAGTQGSSAEVMREYAPPDGEVLAPREVASRSRQIQDMLFERDEEAHQELVNWAGSPLNAITRVGASIANGAELDAGVDADEVATDLADRSTVARERILAVFDVLEDEVTELKEASREFAQLQGQQRLVEQSEGKVTFGGLRDNLERAQARLGEAERRLREAGQPYSLEDLHHEHSLLAQAEDDQTQGELAVLAISYRDSLSEHVELGAGGLVWHPDSEPEASRMLEQVSRCFPASWVRSSSSGYPVRATLTSDRGSYRDAQVTPKLLRTVHLPPNLPPPDSGLTMFIEDSRHSTADFTVWHEVEMEFHESPGGALTISAAPPEGPEWAPHGAFPGGTLWRRPAAHLESPPEIQATAGSEHFRTSVHELAHRFESLVPELGVAQEAFIRRRTLLPNGGQQEPVAMYPGQTPVELVRPDRFTTAYIGRDYESQVHHEVLSTGVEALFGGRFGGLIAARESGPDRDHRGFVLGLLASVPGVESPGRRKV